MRNLKVANARRSSTANTAWLLLQVVEIGLQLLDYSLCLGEIQLRHLNISCGGVQRRKDRVYYRVIDRLLTPMHERRWHDRGCLHLGVSERVLRRLIVSHAPFECADLLIEALSETLGELNCEDLKGWQVQNQYLHIEPFSLLEHHVRARISPRPAEQNTA